MTEPSSGIQFSPLYNPDLAPAGPNRRHWGTYNYAALWVSMSVNILTYMLAVIALVAGTGTALVGLVVPSVSVLYDYSWFVSFALSFAVYYLLMRRTRQNLLRY